MGNTTTHSEAESMGNALAFARALITRDREAWALFMPEDGDLTSAARLLQGAYICLGLLLSDPRLSGSPEREAAKLAELATEPAAHTAIQGALIHLRQRQVLMPQNYKATVEIATATLGLVIVLASDVRLNGTEEELQTLNAKALSMRQESGE